MRILSKMIFTSSWILDAFIFSVTTALLVYKYSTRNLNYWKKRGVYHLKPLPFIGNLLDVLLVKITIAEWLKVIYDSADEPYLGVYVFNDPWLIIKSPELIKAIMVKDFNVFPDRNIACPKHNEIVANMLFMQKNPKWKSFRAKFTPAFSSGKLKAMFSIIKEVNDDLISYVGDNLGVIDAKQLFTRYTTDMISKCVFGINGESFENEKAPMREIGKAMLDNSLRNKFAQAIYFLKPQWVERFRIDLWDKSVTDFFSDVFWQTVKKRRESNQRVNDFVDILRDLMEKDPKFRGDTVVGQAVVFFAAGFESTSSTVSFALYELALNKSIQNRLRNEIMEGLREHGEVTYDSIMGMKYLNSCVSETLRRYPVLPFVDRRCTATYKIPGTELIIEKGQAVYIPLYGLQMDANHFPEPYKFDPERFHDISNTKNNKNAFIPFGEGPRTCIGERFGVLTTKIALVSILSQFEVERCLQTPEIVEFDPKMTTFVSKVGLPLIFKRMNSSTT